MHFAKLDDSPMFRKQVTIASLLKLVFLVPPGLQCLQQLFPALTPGCWLELKPVMLEWTVRATVKQYVLTGCTICVPLNASTMGGQKPQFWPVLAARGMLSWI
jgi:hypothetical protein